MIEVSQCGYFKVLFNPYTGQLSFTDLDESVLYEFNREDLPDMIEALEQAKNER